MPWDVVLCAILFVGAFVFFLGPTIFRRTRAEDFVVVARYHDEGVAGQAKSILDRSGISTQISHNRAALGSQMGPSCLKVKNEDSERARQLLRQEQNLAAGVE